MTTVLALPNGRIDPIPLNLLDDLVPLGVRPRYIWDKYAPLIFSTPTPSISSDPLISSTSIGSGSSSSSSKGRYGMTGVFKPPISAGPHL